MDSKNALHAQEHVIVSSVCIMFLILLSMFGNILICLAVYHSHNLKSQLNYFVVSLALSDLLVASISMPIWLTYEITQFNQLPGNIDVQALVKAWTFIDMLCGVSSICNLTAISCERFWSIRFPLSQRRFTSTPRMVWPIVVVWMYSVVIALSYLLAWKWKYNAVMTAVAGFFLPLAFIVFSYVGVCCTLVRGHTGGRSQLISKHDNRRINVTVMVIIAAFVLCWGPFFVVSLLLHYHQASWVFFTRFPWIRSSVKWLHYLNSCVNPFIYGICNSQYKDALKIVLRRICLTKCSNHYDEYTGANARSSAGTETTGMEKRKELDLKEITESLTCMDSASASLEGKDEPRSCANEYGIILSSDRSSNV